MRCFVRIEGLSPFLLVLEPGFSLEFYKDLVEEYYRSFFEERTNPPDLILIRCIIFSNGDRVMDFKQKKIPDLPPSSIISSPQSPPHTIALPAPSKPGPDSSPPSIAAIIAADPGLAEYAEELRSLSETFVLAVNPSKAKCETDYVISRVPLPRLIRLIADPYCDRYTQSVFWATFTTFTEPSFLLEHLIRRFSEPESVLKAMDQSARENGKPEGAFSSPLIRSFYTNELVPSIQRHIAGIMLEWIRTRPWHFDEPMYQRALSWAETEHKAGRIPFILLKEIEKMDRRPPWERRPVSLTTSGELRTRLPRPPNLASGVSAQHVAEQIHLAISIVYSKILPEELLGGRHDSPSELYKSPNLAQYISLHRRIANWISYSIVSCPVLDERVSIVRRIVFIADALKKMRSWDGVLAVYSGITHKSVSRLRRTFAAVRMHCGVVLDELAELFSSSDGALRFRSEIEASRRNLLPHLPCPLVYLRDISEIERQHPPLINGQVLFARAIRLYNLLEFLLSQQNVRWGIVPDDEILALFEMWKIIPNETLESLSLRAEPPADEDEI